jgi:hypothetical protein
MDDAPDPHENKAALARKRRRALALRENLKRRKSQAKGRAGRSIVTPEDDMAAGGRNSGHRRDET